MRPPFPGMDPWLEHPAIWPQVHNSLIAAIRDELTRRVAPADEERRFEILEAHWDVPIDDVEIDH